MANKLFDDKIADNVIVHGLVASSYILHPVYNVIPFNSVLKYSGMFS